MSSSQFSAWPLLALISLVCACSLDTTPRSAKLDEQEHAGASTAVPWGDRPVRVADPVDGALTGEPDAGGGAGAAGGEPPASASNDAGPAQSDAGTIDDPPDPLVPDAAPVVDAGAPPSTSDAAAPADAALPDSGSGGLLDGIRDALASNPRVQEAAALRRIENALQMRIPTATSLADALDALEDVNCRNNARTCTAVCGWAMANCRLCGPDATCSAELEANCTQSCN